MIIEAIETLEGKVNAFNRDFQKGLNDPKTENWYKNNFLNTAREDLDFAVSQFKESVLKEVGTLAPAIKNDPLDVGAFNTDIELAKNLNDGKLSVNALKQVVNKYKDFDLMAVKALTPNDLQIAFSEYEQKFDALNKWNEHKDTLENQLYFDTIFVWGNYKLKIGLHGSYKFNLALHELGLTEQLKNKLAYVAG